MDKKCIDYILLCLILSCISCSGAVPEDYSSGTAISCFTATNDINNYDAIETDSSQSFCDRVGDRLVGQIGRYEFNAMIEDCNNCFSVYKVMPCDSNNNQSSGLWKPFPTNLDYYHGCQLSFGGESDEDVQIPIIDREYIKSIIDSQIELSPDFSINGVEFSSDSYIIRYHYPYANVYESLAQNDLDYQARVYSNDYDYVFEMGNTGFDLYIIRNTLDGLPIGFYIPASNNQTYSMNINNSIYDSYWDGANMIYTIDSDFDIVKTLRTGIIVKQIEDIIPEFVNELNMISYGPNDTVYIYRAELCYVFRGEEEMETDIMEPAWVFYYQIIGNMNDYGSIVISAYN